MSADASLILINHSTLSSLSYYLDIAEKSVRASKELREALENAMRELAGMRSRMDDLNEFQQLVKEHAEIQDMVNKQRASKRDKAIA